MSRYKAKVFLPHLQIIPDFKVENTTSFTVNFAKRNDKEVFPNTTLIVAGYGRQNIPEGGRVIF